jgi:hypothetical protein
MSVGWLESIDRPAWFEEKAEERPKRVGIFAWSMRNWSESILTEPVQDSVCLPMLDHLPKTRSEFWKFDEFCRV